MVFIANIKKIGGVFYKAARTPSMMGVIPPITKPKNLQTYFVPWPRRFSSYIMSEDAPRMEAEARSHPPKGNAAVGKVTSVGAVNAGGGGGGGGGGGPPGAGGGKKKKVTLRTLAQKQHEGRPISMLTAYEGITARLAEQAGVDILLVGDSVGNVLLGYESTVPVTMEEMLVHSRAVTRCARRPLIIGDMPFGSYLTTEDALHNACAFMKDGGCEAVKMEGGGTKAAQTVRALTEAGISVMGHLGLTPQSYVQLGGYRAQGTSAKEAFQVVEDAEELAKAGCFAIVLECLPNELAEAVTARLAPLGVATIGIGAGTACSGQVLVCADLLGLSPHTPRFARQYLELGPQIRDAFASYAQDVESGAFPDEARMPKPMCPKELEGLRRLMGETAFQPEGATMAEEELTRILSKENGQKMNPQQLWQQQQQQQHQQHQQQQQNNGSIMSLLTGTTGGTLGGLLLSRRTMVAKAEEQPEKQLPPMQ